jgi:hypothetical protein
MVKKYFRSSLQQHTGLKLEEIGYFIFSSSYTSKKQRFLIYYWLYNFLRFAVVVFLSVCSLFEFCRHLFRLQSSADATIKNHLHQLHTYSPLGPAATSTKIAADKNQE